MGKITKRVGLSNISEQDINPATEEKQDDLLDNEKKATASTIYTVTMTTAGQEYSQALPDNTVSIDIKLRVQGASLTYSWSAGGDYMTVHPGGSRHINNIVFTGKTIYLKSPSASQTAEIEVLTQ